MAVIVVVSIISIKPPRAKQESEPYPGIAAVTSPKGLWGAKGSTGICDYCPGPYGPSVIISMYPACNTIRPYLPYGYRDFRHWNRGKLGMAECAPLQYCRV